MRKIVTMRIPGKADKIYILLAFLLLNFSALGQISGIFTIDKNGSGTNNFTSFGAAVSALTTSGVSGPTVFHVKEGSYNERFTIPAITGSSTTNTITFQAAPTNSAPAEIAYNSVFAIGTYAIRLNGTSNIYFKDLVFSAPSGYDYRYIEMIGANSNIGFEGNKFRVLSPSQGVGFDAVAVGLSYSVSSSISGNFMFRSNTIKNFNEGLRVFGESNTCSLDTCLILNNTLDLYGEGAHGVEVTYFKHCEFSNNDIDFGSFLGTGGGMNDFTKFQTSFIASNNHIVNTESGIHTHIDLPDTVSPPSVEITNNTIKSDRWGITIASLNLDTSSTHIGNLKVVGNTIDVLGEYIDGCLFISGVNCSSGAPGIISNNMLSMRNDGSEFYNVLEIKHSNELKVYHNSISSFGNAAPNLAHATVEINTENVSSNFPCSNIDIFNNIISNTTGGKLISVEGVTSSALMSLLSCDYNNYYGDFQWNNQLFKIGSNLYGLAGWTSSFQQDANSIWGNPNFTDTTDLHILSSPALNAGTPLGVFKDIDNQVRLLSQPDIGADEYSLSTYRLKVDMNADTANSSGVYVTGNFQNWQPGSSQMLDSGGDGVYEYDVTLNLGDTLLYKFLNGNSISDTESVPLLCQWDSSGYRGVVLTLTNDSADAVCYSTCSICFLGTEEIVQNLIVFPNPTSGMITIQKLDRLEPKIIQVINVMGRVVLEDIWQVGENHQNIDMSSFAPGMYTIRLKTDDEVINFHVVRQ